MKDYPCPECLSPLRCGGAYPDRSPAYCCSNIKCGWSCPMNEKEIMDLVQAYAELRRKEKLSKGFDAMEEFERGYTAGHKRQDCVENSTNYLSGFLRGLEFANHK